MKTRLLLLCGLWILAGRADLLAGETSSFPVTIRVHAGRSPGAMIPTWRFFGADEADYTYMRDGQKLLGELGGLGRDDTQVYFRCHHLLTSGDGAYALKWSSTSAYKETPSGEPVYDWAINDRIFDACLQHHVRPYVEIGFMPEALTTHPQNYPHHPPVNRRVPYDAGQAYPPKDYAKWGELIHRWVEHCVEHYGRAEVEKWYWEVWNEPNVGYWHGSVTNYCELYDYAVDGVRRALPTARVGGPETADGPGGKFLGSFLEHCARGTNFVTGGSGAPLDFISFHAKGSPKFIDDHVRMGMGNQFRNINDSFAVIASFPEFKKLPVIIGESDPEGCAACREPHDAYRNGTMYSSYTAASFPREFELAEKYGVNFQGALTWAFEFEDQPPFAGFRQLASAGIDLPVLNVFRMFSKMSGVRLEVDSTAGIDAQTILHSGVRNNPDVSAFACLDRNTLTVLAWHYHDDDVPGPEAEVEVDLDHLPVANGVAKLTQYRIDREHSNSFEVWKRMGSPAELSKTQQAELEKAGQLEELDSPHDLPIHAGEATVKLRLPRSAVSLLQLEWSQ